MLVWANWMNRHIMVISPAPNIPLIPDLDAGLFSAAALHSGYCDATTPRAALGSGP
jgi:hypothetical protein